MTRFLLVILCLAGTAIAQTPPGSSAPDGSSSNAQNAAASDPNEVKARQLISQMVQALGGDAYMNFTTRVEEGRTNGFYHGQPTGATAPFWRFYKFPDKERVELTKQRDVIVIHNGGRGTETTYHGTRPEDDDIHREYVLRDQYSMENVLRSWLKAPGSTFFYDGTGFTDNHQVERVTVANSQNQQETFSIDISTHLPVRKSFTVRDPKYKDKDTYTDVFSEYRPVQDIQTPHVVTRLKDEEMISQRFLTKVSYNDNLADSLFIPPTSIAKKK
jgi:hypothetical protein